MKIHPIAAAVFAATTGATLLAQPAWSQENGGLEEIIVTATRREQNLQDVPIAVVAYTGEMLERQGIENMEDLKAVVPNVIVAGNLGGSDTASFTMRGIPNVGTYIDGIWQVSNNGLLLREFVDLDRVEVLRGPQGTLYGRDSTGGAIRLYTKPPSDEYGVQVDMTVGNLDRRDVKGALNIPLTDKFRTRWTVGSYDRDGYITSLTTGQKTGSFEDEVIRADFIWEPSERVSVRFNAQSDEITSTQARVNTFIDPQIGFNTGHQLPVSLGPTTSRAAVAGTVVTSARALRAVSSASGKVARTSPCPRVRGSSNRPSTSRSTSRTTSPSNTLWVIPTTTRVRYNDWDAGEFNFYIDYFLNELDLTSHEFQFSGGTDRISWVGGAYFWSQKGRSRNPAYSMGDWEEVANILGGYPNMVPEFSYANDVLATPAGIAACNMTPAQRGITSWAPHVAAGYAPASALALNVNSVNGWPTPCGFAPADWPFVIRHVLAATRGRPLDRRRDRRVCRVRRGHVQSQREVRHSGRLPFPRPGSRPVLVQRRCRSRGRHNGAQAGGPKRRVFVGQHLRRHSGSGRPARGPSTPIRFACRAAGTWTDDVMMYLGYTEGFNSGGLAVYTEGLGQVQSAYDPESIENTELGIRSDLLDGRLRLNATYFSTDWFGIQLLAVVNDRAPPFGELTELVYAERSFGERRGFRGRADLRCDGQPDAQCEPRLARHAVTDTQSPAVKLDTEFSAAPDNTYAFGLEYDASLSKGGGLVTRVDYIYTGPYWRAATPSLRQNAYGVSRSYESGDYWRPQRADGVLTARSRATS